MIELQDVRHVFPTRPDVVITDGLNISFSPNQTTVLVGATGSGKSSIGHLLVQFYDPLRGKILLVGHDIRSVNVRWLRRHVRLLGQDPVLFDTPIFENIRHGLIGTEYESLSDSDEKLTHIIEQAARKACVHDFITSLPLGYRTLVGGRGLKLSGGQRQRIALARALVADPKILILGETTSALDDETETKVLRALVSDSQSRTTIIVAHRLSAVCDAGTIVGLDHGVVVETGTHVALMSNNGVYKNVFEAQKQEIRPRSEPKGLGQTCIVPIRSSIEGQQEMEKSETCITTDSIIGSTIDFEEAQGTTSFRVSALSLLLFVLRLNKAEFYPLLVGTVCSIIAGFEEPVAAVLFSNVFTALSLPSDESSQILSSTGFWSLMFVTLALVQLLVFGGLGLAFAYCSEWLIFNVRSQALAAMLHQDVIFDQEGQSGSLVAFLSTEAIDLASLSGATLGTIIIAVSTLTSSFVVAISFGWKLALVCSVAIPVLFTCGLYGVQAHSTYAKETQESKTAATSYASQAMAAMHTVASMTMEQTVVDRLESLLQNSTRTAQKANVKLAVSYSLSKSLVFGCMGFGFWYGGRLILDLEYSLFRFTIVYLCIIQGSQSAGLVFSFTPNMGRAKASACNVQQLLDRRPKIDPRSSQGITPVPLGTLSFENVSFEYPT